MRLTDKVKNMLEKNVSSGSMDMSAFLNLQYQLGNCIGSNTDNN